jgi:mannose-6-phosphate isomerase class I
VPLRRPYDPLPCYPCVGGQIVTGWTAPCAEIARRGGVQVLAIDGPAVLDGSGLDWTELAATVADELRALGLTVDLLDVRDHFSSWDQIVKRTSPVEALRDDPDFATLAGGTLADLSDEMPAPSRAPGRCCLVFGPGAGLVDHDVLWYTDLPKRYAEAAITAGRATNLGQPAGAGPGTTRRLFYVDWPLLDRHRDALAGHVDRWFDVQHRGRPTSIAGATLHATAAQLAGRPFRTRPTFNTTSWGGHWAQEELGFNPDARNTALGYELIAPESGVLVGDVTAFVEVPFQLLVAMQPVPVLGPDVHDRFGTSFPIRFDYLDTVGGGSLSVHCHPREEPMRAMFGWPYTQHETYYVMVGGPEHVIYLGLHGDADIEAFHHRAHEADEHAVPFDIEQFVQTFPAEPHQLFLVPAGTPHGSGVGNVVLEVSATPYLYSLRFYDWLRRDPEGRQRPVHVEHAFANLNRDRRGDAVRTDLVQQPLTATDGDGWRDEVIGTLPEMFFEVHRVVLQPGGTATLPTDDRFCVLNLVEGEGAEVRWEGGSHDLAYAETIVVPASVGSYEVSAVGDSPARLVRAFVR